MAEVEIGGACIRFDQAAMTSGNLSKTRSSAATPALTLTIFISNRSQMPTHDFCARFEDEGPYFDPDISSSSSSDSDDEPPALCDLSDEETCDAGADSPYDNATNTRRDEGGVLGSAAESRLAVSAVNSESITMVYTICNANFRPARIAHLERNQPAIQLADHVVRLVAGLSLQSFPFSNGRRGTVCPRHGGAPNSEEMDDEAVRKWMVREDQAIDAAVNTTIGVAPLASVSPAITSSDIPLGGIPSSDTVFEAYDEAERE